jgi:folate-binding protein YgfZ
MESQFQKEYRAVRENGSGFYRQKCEVIEVSGGEAVMFLNGLITNDVAKLESNRWMAAAFPNAQGRLLALVKVLRLDDKFLFVTDEVTYEKVLQNLSRFTLAGDFKVNDLTEKFSCISVWGKEVQSLKSKVQSLVFPGAENEISSIDFEGGAGFVIRAFRADGFDFFVPKDKDEGFISDLKNQGAIPLSEETLEVLRIENGEPKYGVDMDETTVVLETGLDEAVSFNKGCYIGQEIIARIHFRGHVAKKLTGLILENKAEMSEPPAAAGGFLPNSELKSLDGKNAGRITSVTFSPTLEKQIALVYVRYDYLAEGTELKVNDAGATVKNLPFVS